MCTHINLSKEWTGNITIAGSVFICSGATSSDHTEVSSYDMEQTKSRSITYIPTLYYSEQYRKLCEELCQFFILADYSFHSEIDFFFIPIALF